MDPFKKGFTQSDLEIMKRLEKLREDRVIQEPIPSDSDIRKRLANLRNEPEASYSKSNLPIVKPKSDQEQCDNLLKQYMDECKIEDKRNAVDSDVSKRLQNLKGEPVLSTGQAGMASEAVGGAIESKSDAITRVIQEAMLAPSDDELSDTYDYENNTSDELSSSDEDNDDSI